MKFGIITLVSDNYGNKYQNYAVEQILLNYGEVETYRLAEVNAPLMNKQKSLLSKLNPSYVKSVLVARMMYQFDINRTDKGIIYNIIYTWKNKQKLLTLKKAREDKFRDFSKHNLHISKKVLDNASVKNKEWLESIDYFICGSDQIWNPTYSTTSELAFCTFASETTICMAPSFGVTDIPDYRKEEYALWLQNINQLSVREEAGQTIICELTGRKAELLIDPTMVLTKEKWDELSEKPKVILPDHYIVGYFLGCIDSDYKKKIEKISHKKNLPIVMLFDITIPDYYVMGPEEVLYIIRHSDYVVTDSFHGTVFSILFHKSFSVFQRNEGGASMNSRIDTLLAKFDLKDRFFNDQIENISVEKWCKVELILKEEKVKTQKYIQRSLGLTE